MQGLLCDFQNSITPINGNTNFGWTERAPLCSEGKVIIFISQTELPALHCMDNIPLDIHQRWHSCKNLFMMFSVVFTRDLIDWMKENSHSKALKKKRSWKCNTFTVLMLFRGINLNLIKQSTGITEIIWINKKYTTKFRRQICLFSKSIIKENNYT